MGKTPKAIMEQDFNYILSNLLYKKSSHGGSQSTQVRYHIKYLYLLVQETWEQLYI